MKYLGSKNRISKELVPIIQSYITPDTKGYLEPFVGGANVIDKIDCKRRIGCDIHKELIALLIQVRDGVYTLPKTISEETYRDVKNNRDKYPDWYVGFVGFLCSFGGRYFAGFARGKNPDGSPRNYADEGFRNLSKQAPKLKDITFLNKDFRSLPKDIEGFVIYCDPPYRNTTKYVTKDFPYEEFYKWCKEMAKKNTVLISEYSMPEEDFKCIWEKPLKILLGKGVNKNSDRNRIEKLFIVK